MTNTEKLTAQGCYFPCYINSEELIRLILTLEGLELYQAFGFNDTASCTKFLGKFIPGKPKNARFNKYVKDLLDIPV